MTDTLPLLFLIPSSFFGALGSIYLKKGSKKITFNFNKIMDNFTAGIGFVLFGTSSLFYIAALKYNDLTVVYPLSSITYVLISIFSIHFLKEKMNKIKWIGILFIMLGSILVVR